MKKYKFSGMITANVVYYSPAQYGMAQHARGRITFFSEEELRANVKNADSVLARCGARHIALDEGTGLAFQIGGYNNVRGSYCDVLTIEEMQPYTNRKLPCY